MKFSDYINETKLSKLDATYFAGFVSGQMSSVRAGGDIKDAPGSRTKKKESMWNKLIKMGLIQDENLGDDEHVYSLTKKGLAVAKQMEASGEIYNPNKVKF